MSAVYIVPALLALTEELPPACKVRNRARSAAAIFLIPYEFTLTASLREAELDAFRAWGKAFADSERKTSAGRARRDESDLGGAIFLNPEPSFPVGRLICRSSHVIPATSRRRTIAWLRSNYVSEFVTVGLGAPCVEANALEFHDNYLCRK
jgi:hypothetical protein